jgi:hypothetical protein
LLEHFVLTETQEMRDGIVCLQDLAFQVCDEDWIGSICDDDVGGKQAGRPAGHGLPNGISHGEDPPGPVESCRRT